MPGTSANSYSHATEDTLREVKAAAAAPTSLPLPAGAATSANQGTQITAEQAILAALVAGGYVGSRLESLVNEDFATQATLVAVLAKLSGDPSTATLQGTGNGTLASILAKIIAAPATEAKQEALGVLATQATLALVLAQLDNKTSTLATSAQMVSLLADGTIIEKTPVVAAVVDGGEVQITGLTIGGFYELVMFSCSPHSGGGIATHRQHRLYNATGGAIADLRWEAPTDLAVADGVFYPYNPGNILKADAAGKLWLRYEVTGGGSITETVCIYLKPRRSA